MSDPEFFVCNSCDTPAYAFEFENNRLVSIYCAVCGNDDPEDFISDLESEDEE